MRKTVCIWLTFFIFVLFGCHTEKSQELKTNLVFYYDSARIDVPEIKDGMDNSITQITSYSSYVEALPGLSDELINSSFFEEFDLFFISFMTTKEEGRSVLLSEVFQENRTLYFYFNVFYKRLSKEDSESIVNSSDVAYCRYGVRVRKKDIQNLAYADIKVLTVSDVPIYSGGEPVDLNSSTFYKCCHGKTYGYNFLTGIYDISMRICLV